MNRLSWIVYVMAAPTLAGMLVTAALSLNMVSNRAVLVSVIVGFLAALPVAAILGKMLSNGRRRSGG